MKLFELGSTNKFAGGTFQNFPSGKLAGESTSTSRLAGRAFAGHDVLPMLARRMTKPNNEIVRPKARCTELPSFVQRTRLPGEFPEYSSGEACLRFENGLIGREFWATRESRPIPNTPKRTGRARTIITNESNPPIACSRCEHREIKLEHESNMLQGMLNHSQCGSIEASASGGGSVTSSAANSASRSGHRYSNDAAAWRRLMIFAASNADRCYYGHFWQTSRPHFPQHPPEHLAWWITHTFFSQIGTSTAQHGTSPEENLQPCGGPNDRTSPQYHEAWPA